MSDAGLSAAFALGAAVSMATFSLIVRRGQVHAGAVTGVLIGLWVNVPILLAATWALWRPEWWNARALAWFALSGVTGPSLGRVFMYLAIHRLGVARAVPMLSTGPLLTAALAIAFLGERPGAAVWAGTLLVVAGSAGITYKPAGDRSWDRRHLWLPIAAVAAFGVSNVFRKAGLTIVPSPLLGVAATSLAGLILLVPLAPLLPGQRGSLRVPGKAWLFYGVCGAINTCAFGLNFYALRTGDLTVVTPLVSTSPVFSLALSTVFLRDVERVTPPIVGGTVLVVLGGILIAWRSVLG